MTIYMTHSKLAASAAALDKARLHSQIQAVGKMLKSMHNESMNHKPTLESMAWEDQEAALAFYGIVMCDAWTRWRPSSQMQQITRYARWFADVYHEITETEFTASHPPELPPWMGDKDVHRSHRSVLIKKLPSRYNDMFPETPVNMPILRPQLISERAMAGDECKPYCLRISDEDVILLERGEVELPEHLQYDPSKREVLRVSGG